MLEMAHSPAYERIEAAVKLEKLPDRVPFVPLLDMFACRYAGVSQHDLFFSVRKADQAVQKTLDDMGRIDGFSLSYAGLASLLRLMAPAPPVIPGLNGVPENATWQFVEVSIMGPNEYRQIGERGAIRWILDKSRESRPELNTLPGLAKVGVGAAYDVLRVLKSVRTWRLKGVEPLVGINISFTPMEYIAIMLRSFNEFMLDLYRYPEDLKEASKALTPMWRMLGLALVAATGVRRVFLGGARTCSEVIGPKQFEELALPEWRGMSEFFIKFGITPLLHLDGDWTDFLPYFKDFPRGKCILNLDGATDIFKAKEILGDHMCIMGDVPATLLKLGEPDEVDDYCKHLINEVGEGGGFILGTGCALPIDARPENVAAMFAAAQRYGKY